MNKYRLNWEFRNQHRWSKDFGKIGEVFQYFGLLGLKNDPNISKVWIEKINDKNLQVIETLV